MGKLIVLQTVEKKPLVDETEPVKEVIEVLEELMVMARKGELRGIVGLALNTQQVGHIIVGDMDDRLYTMVGGLDILKDEVKLMYLEEEE